MKTKGIKESLLIFALLAPHVAYAQTLNTLLQSFLDVIGDAIPVTIGIGVLLFLWGLATYIFKTDSAEGREGAKSRMFWGIIAIFVMVSIWGLVSLLQVITGTDTAPISPTPPVLLEDPDAFPS